MIDGGGMKKQILLAAVFLFFAAVALCIMGDDPDRSKVYLPDAAARLLPDNGEVIASVKADLDGDGRDDFLVAFEYLNAERELIIITNPGGKYMVAARSKRVILCKECGGIYGDPFVRIWAEKKKFGVDHFGGSNWKWSNNSEFGYSKRDKKWQLISFQSAEYDLDNNVKSKTYKSRDFGLINLEDFDLGSSVTEDTIKPVPDETKTALIVEKTAVAATKTEIVVESYTPTTVPTYVYSRAEQLKNREMIEMKGGTFTQTDGPSSFKNTLSPYKIGKYPVTYELWYVVDVWAVKNGYKFHAKGGMCGDRFRDKVLPEKDSITPVVGISWRDCVVWCNAYSQMTGLKPVYCSDEAFKNPIKSSEFGNFPSSEDTTKGSFDFPYVDWAANGYRLATEAEWLYAATYIDGQKRLEPLAVKNDANSSGFVYLPGKGSEFVWDLYTPYPQTDQKDYRVSETNEKYGGPRTMHGGPDPDEMEKKYKYALVEIGKRIKVYPLVSEIYSGLRVAQSK
jgi:hypothetical protein